MEEQLDVIVVGAGLAGLCAAYEMDKRGLNVVVLEARERVGGRVHTLREPFADGQYVEAGAEYLEGNEEQLLEYMERFALQRAYDFHGYDKAQFQGEVDSFWEPKKIPEAWAEVMSSHWGSADLRSLCYRPLYESLAEEHPKWDEARLEAKITKMSVLEAATRLKWDETLLAYLRFRLVGTEGVSLENVSASALYEEPWDDDYAKKTFRIEGGNARLPEAFAAALEGKIRLGCQAQRIEQSYEHAVVTFQKDGENEAFYAPWVVVAVPGAVVSHLQFAPPLPKAKEVAFSQILHTPVMKVLLQFRERFWEKNGWNGNLLSDHPISCWFGAGEPSGNSGILDVYVSGKQADAFRGKEPVACLEMLVLMFPELFAGARESFLTGQVANWIDDPLTLGGWAMYPPGQELEFLEELEVPHGRCFFAGEYLAQKEEAFGTMEGAISSGRWCAKMVFQNFRMEKKEREEGEEHQVREEVENHDAHRLQKERDECDELREQHTTSEEEEPVVRGTYRSKHHQSKT